MRLQALFVLAAFPVALSAAFAQESSPLAANDAGVVVAASQPASDASRAAVREQAKEESRTNAFARTGEDPNYPHLTQIGGMDWASATSSSGTSGPGRHEMSMRERVSQSGFRYVPGAVGWTRGN